MHVEDKSPSTKAGGETLLKHISNVWDESHGLSLIPHTQSPFEEQMLPVVLCPQVLLPPHKHLPWSAPAAAMHVGSQAGHDDESTHGPHVPLSHVGFASEHAELVPQLHSLSPTVGTLHVSEAVGLQISFASVSLEH